MTSAATSGSTRWWAGPFDASRQPELVAGSCSAIEHLRVDGRRAGGWASMSGFVRAADGWGRLHAHYLHHADAVLALPSPAPTAPADLVLRTASVASPHGDVVAPPALLLDDVCLERDIAGYGTASLAWRPRYSRPRSTDVVQE